MNTITISLPNLSTVKDISVEFEGMELHKAVFDEIYKNFIKMKKKSLNVLALQINPRVIYLINRFDNTNILSQLKRDLVLEDKPSKYFKLDVVLRKEKRSAVDYIHHSFNKYDMFKFFYALLEDATVELMYQDKELYEFELNKKQDVQLHLQNFVNDIRIGTKTELNIQVTYSIKKALNLLSKENPSIYLLLKEDAIISELEEAVNNIQTTIKIELEGGV